MPSPSLEAFPEHRKNPVSHLLLPKHSQLHGVAGRNREHLEQCAELGGYRATKPPNTLRDGPYGARTSTVNTRR